MVSIDEAISKYKEITNTKAICPGHCNISCDKCLQESKQIAEWLEELKTIKSDGFTDNLLNMGFTKGYNKALDDFVKLVKEHNWNIRNRNENEFIYGAIDRLAEQLKVGGREWQEEIY